MQRTHVVHKERSPEWNRVFRLASGSLATDMLRVSVLHEGSANMNEVIGEVWIRLAELWKQSWADPIAPSLRRVARQAFVLKDAQENVVTSFEDYGNGKETRNACVNLAFSIDVQQAEASVPADLERELKKIKASKGGCGALDRLAIGSISGAKYAMHQGALLKAVSGDAAPLAALQST